MQAVHEQEEKLLLASCPRWRAPGLGCSTCRLPRCSELLLTVCPRWEQNRTNICKCNMPHWLSGLSVWFTASRSLFLLQPFSQTETDMLLWRNRCLERFITIHWKTLMLMSSIYKATIKNAYLCPVYSFCNIFYIADIGKKCVFYDDTKPSVVWIRYKRMKSRRAAA